MRPELGQKLTWAFDQLAARGFARLSEARLKPRRWKVKQFFFGKKNQKTFTLLGHGRCRHHSPCPQEQSFFASFFSKKEVLPLLQPRLGFTRKMRYKTRYSRRFWSEVLNV
jgi:hypothetical protein